MLKGLIRGLLDIIYPKICIVCKIKLKEKPNIDNLICLGCWGSIKRNLPPFCHFCGRHLEKKNITRGVCPSCTRQRFSFDRAFSPCLYEEPIKGLIHQFKYRQKDYLGFTLSRLLIEFIREYHLPIEYVDMIIPVPLHKTKMREREFNQAETLSKCLGDEFSKPVIKDNLIRRRPTKSQTELPENERLANVRGSFSVRDAAAIKTKNILLVDDVLTTASTCSEAALALKDAGANIVFVLTLAN